MANVIRAPELVAKLRELMNEIMDGKSEKASGNVGELTFKRSDGSDGKIVVTIGVENIPTPFGNLVDVSMKMGTHCPPSRPGKVEEVPPEVPAKKSLIKKIVGSKSKKK